MIKRIFNKKQAVATTTATATTVTTTASVNNVTGFVTTVTASGNVACTVTPIVSTAPSTSTPIPVTATTTATTSITIPMTTTSVCSSSLTTSVSTTAPPPPPQPQHTTSILNRLKLQLENVVSLKQHPTQQQHQQQSQQFTIGSSTASSGSSSETTIELAKYVPHQPQHASEQDTSTSKSKKQSKKNTKTPSPTTSTSTLTKSTSSTVVGIGSLSSGIVLNSLTTTTPATATTATTTTTTAKFDYPLRTRLYRHLSSGNAALSPTSATSYTAQSSATPSMTSIPASTNPDDFLFNQYLANLSTDDAVRRQSWGSYSYLAAQQQQQQNQQATGTCSSGTRSPYHRLLLPGTYKSTGGNMLLQRTAIQPHQVNYNNNNSSSNSSIFENFPPPIMCESNLIKLKSNKLGSSAPNLSHNLKELNISRKNSSKRRSVYYQQTSNGGGNNSSITSNGSMSSSPSTPLTLNTAQQHHQHALQLGTSPLDSPRSSVSSASNLKQTHSFQQKIPCSGHHNPHHHHHHHHHHQYHDARRWSFTSVQSSSGYGSIPSTKTCPSTTATVANENSKGTTSGVGGFDSNQSSQYSSNEKLIHAASCTASTAASSPAPQAATNRPIPNTELLQVHERRSRLCSSNDSSNLDDSSDGGYLSPSLAQQHHHHHHQQQQQQQQQQPHVQHQQKRQRARSLSCSPSKLHNESDIIQIQNEKFKEKFPKACKQMEENLQQFINQENVNVNSIQSNTSTDAAARFILIQIIELAKSCLDKSKASQLTCGYFDELTNSIEKLLNESRDKCELTSIHILHCVVKKFLLIIARVARLLECIEFDPLEFCFWLNAAEIHARNLVKTDIPKYIISKLGLNRDPLFEDFTITPATATTATTATPTTSLAEPTTTMANVTTGSGQDLMLDKTIMIGDLTEQKEERHQPCEDDFEELKLISNGAYGAVHLVREKQTNERYAMKKIRKHNLILRNQVQQVFTERDIMTFTDNPFVVALICTFETKKYLCMVMEYVEGGDVATLIKNMGPLPLDMARTYFAETTLAVEYLHSYGIIHRDLKPDNLLITSMGHIKLTDFGLSKIGLMNLTTNFYESHYATRKDQYCKEFNDKQICGTPQYLASEVILRQGYGKTVDWWSMGIILYEFLTSVTPFNGNTPEELFDNVINGEILWPDNDDDLAFIPEDAKNLIKGLLKHDPLERLGAGGAVEIKEHPFFNPLDWDNLLRIKADFIPQLDGPDDTSYFDTRSERYNHFTNNLDQIKMESSNGSGQGKVSRSAAASKQLQQNDDDLDDDTDNELFASFSSCSSKFKHHNSTTSITTPSASLTTTPTPAITTPTTPIKELAVVPSTTTTTTAMDETCVFIKPSTPPPLSVISTSIDQSDTAQTSPTSPEILAELEKLCINEKPVITEATSQKPVNVTGHVAVDTPTTKPLDDTNFKSSTTSLNSQAIAKPSVDTSGMAANVNTNKNNRLALRQTRSHLSSSSFCVKKPDNNSYRFPNSLSHSKLSLLSVPGDDLTKQQQQQQQQPSNRQLYKQNSFKNQSFNYNNNSVEARAVRELTNESTAKPAICIKRGPRGFGFTLQAIKVYYGDTNTYTIQHVVVQVDETGPAYAAGLRAQDLITHVNDKLVCGMFHHEIIKCILSNNTNLRLHTVQFDKTNIKRGGRKRSPSKSKLSRPGGFNNNNNNSGNSTLINSSQYSGSQTLLANVSSNSGLSVGGGASRRSIGSNSHLDCVQQPQPQQERRKKATLFRKLSERRAQRYDMYNNMQPQQQQPPVQQPLQTQQTVQLQQSQSRRNISVGDLRVGHHHNPSTPQPQSQHQQQRVGVATVGKQSSFDSSSSSSPVSSVPTSPAIQQNSRPRSLIMLNTNGMLLGAALQQASQSQQQQQQQCSTPQTTHASSSSSSLSSSPLNMQQQFHYQQMQSQQQQQQQQFQYQQQQQQQRLSYPYFNCGSIILTANPFYTSTSPSSNCSSCTSSCSSLNCPQSLLTSQQPQPQQQQPQLQQQPSQQPPPQLIHLNPSPLAISDGLPLTYGNPNITQTFTPASQQQQQLQRPKLVITNVQQPLISWQQQLSPTINLVPLIPYQHAQLQKSQTYFNYPTGYTVVQPQPQHVIPITQTQSLPQHDMRINYQQPQPQTHQSMLQQNHYQHQHVHHHQSPPPPPPPPIQQQQQHNNE